MSRLFEPLTLRNVSLRNRIIMSPMCQYSATDGLASDWHHVHYGTRAVGGVGMVMVEATAVVPEGRISAADLGIWSDRHTEALAGVARVIRSHGAVAGIQLAHAGRKAAVQRPWDGGNPLTPDQGGWPVVGPSAIPFAAGYPLPTALDHVGIDAVVEAWRQAAQRALAAGFQVVEVHMAHGYLLHEFLSPLSNRRDDDYGGPLYNRMRLPLRVAQAVREVWPDELPVLARLSATDWVEGGWTVDDSVTLAAALHEIGIDMIDCSSAGLTPDAPIPVAPGFQVPSAAEIRRRAGVPTAAVGLIQVPEQAEQILVTGLADAVCLGRVLLRDPYWPLYAAQVLKAKVDWPPQYWRAKG